MSTVPRKAVKFNHSITHSINIQQFSYKKINFEMISASWQQFCLSLSVLTYSLLLISDTLVVFLIIGLGNGLFSGAPVNYMILHIEAETKWLPFSRWHFHVHFLQWKCMNFDKDFTYVCSEGSNNIPALVQIALHQSGDKPLSEPMMVSLLTHICVTQPQRVNLDFG